MSLLAGAVTTLNSAAFILLAPGPALSEYLACSAIYSATGWFILWILPAAWPATSEAPRALRATQALCAGVAICLMLASFPSWIGLAFSALLASETVFFFSAILLFKTRSTIYQRIELARSVSNLLSLVITIGLLDARPAAYLGLLFFTSLLLGCVSSLWGIHRTSGFSASDLSLRNVHQNFTQALGSGPVRALLLARGVEVVSLLAMSAASALGAQICLKIGLAIGQALSWNAKQYKALALAGAALVVYATALLFAATLAKLAHAWAPATLSLISMNAAALAAPIFLVHLLLLLFALGSSRQVQNP